MQLSHVAQLRKPAHTLGDDPLLVRRVAKVLLPREPPELLTRLMREAVEKANGWSLQCHIAWCVTQVLEARARRRTAQAPQRHPVTRCLARLLHTSR